MSDIKEDIKILKELKEVQERCIENTQDSPFTMLWKKQNQAIENILNRLEQDERVIEEMAEYIKNEWGFANKNEVIDHFRKKCE